MLTYKLWPNHKIHLVLEFNLSYSLKNQRNLLQGTQVCPMSWFDKQLNIQLAYFLVWTMWIPTVSNICSMASAKSLKGEGDKNHSFLHSKRQLSVKISTFLNVDKQVHSKTCFSPGWLCKLYSWNASLGYSGASPWCLIHVLLVRSNSTVHFQ